MNYEMIGSRLLDTCRCLGIDGKDPLYIVDHDDDSAEEVTLATLKPFPEEISLATLLFSETPEPALDSEETLLEQLEIPISEITLKDRPSGKDQYKEAINGKKGKTNGKRWFSNSRIFSNGW